MRRTLTLALLGLVVSQTGCRQAPTPAALITIDGSSTVYPLTEAIAEDFQHAHGASRIAIGIAGTGGGLRRFCRGDVVIADASRPITADEAADCHAAGIRYVELPIALDGIVVAVHPSNTWVDALSVEELRHVWQHQAEGRVLSWAQVRPGFPDREIHLFGAGVDSGTFDDFTRAVTGTARDSRGDYTASEDDNLLVQGVASDPDALGYFGYAYFEAHRETLRAVPIRVTHDAAPVVPSEATIRSGAYRPLSRQVYLYVDAAALQEPPVHAFVSYYLMHVADVATDVGYVPLDDETLRAARASLVTYGGEAR